MLAKKKCVKLFVWILIDSYKSTKLKLVDVQKSFIDNFKTEDEFDLFNQNFEITKMMMTEKNLVLFKNF